MNNSIILTRAEAGEIIKALDNYDSFLCTVAEPEKSQINNDAWDVVERKLDSDSIREAWEELNGKIKVHDTLNEFSKAKGGLIQEWYQKSDVLHFLKTIGIEIQ